MGTDPTHTTGPEVPIQGEELSSLEMKMATAILFMPEIGHLTTGATKEIIRRCAQVATEHFDGCPPHVWMMGQATCVHCGEQYDNDPPPAPLVADPKLITHRISSGAKVPPPYPKFKHGEV